MPVSNPWLNPGLMQQQSFQQPQPITVPPAETWGPGAMSGAMQGATAGSMFGPYGTAIGGGLGYGTGAKK